MFTSAQLNLGTGSIRLLFAPNPHYALVVAVSEEKQQPFSMAIGLWGTRALVFAHAGIGTARMNQEKVTEGMKRDVSMERSRHKKK